jgi:hypothetical protein
LKVFLSEPTFPEYSFGQQVHRAMLGPEFWRSVCFHTTAFIRVYSRLIENVTLDVKTHPTIDGQGLTANPVGKRAA